MGTKSSTFSRILTIFIFIFACNVILICGIFGYMTIGQRLTSEEISGVVTNAYPIYVENGTVYRVHIQYSDESTETFNVIPNIAFGNFDIASDFAKLNKGATIKGTATGFNLSGLGMYRNLTNIEVVE